VKTPLLAAALACLLLPAGGLAPRLAWAHPAGNGAAAAPARPAGNGAAAPAAGAPAASAPAPAFPAQRQEGPGAVTVEWFVPGSAPGTGSGGGLNALQARRLRRIRRAARAWQAALAPLGAAARQQGDAPLQRELAQLDALLQQLVFVQQATLTAYVAALRASNEALALWAANADYVDPGEQQAWQQAAAAAADLTTAADTGFVFGADLSAGTAWTYAEGLPAKDTAGPPAGETDIGAGEIDADGGGMPSARTGAAPDAAVAPDGGALPALEPDDASAPTAALDEAPPGTVDGDPIARLASGATASAAAASSDGAVAPAAGAWVVIHGGPDAAVQAAEALPGAAAPAFALQVDELQDDPPLSPEDASRAEGDAATMEIQEDAPPFDEEEICRPWHPDGVARDLCPLPPAAFSP